MDRIRFDTYDFFGYLASGLVLVVGMELIFGFPKVLGQELGIVDTAVLLLGVYVAGHAVATPAKALLEDGLVDRVLRRPNANLFIEKRPRVRGFLFPGFHKPLPEPIRKKVLAKAERDGLTGNGEALFLHVRYSPKVLQNERLMQRLDGFINKYGFSRNLSFASFAVGVGLSVKAAAVSDSGLTTYAATALTASGLLLYRYLKFLRLYSLEMFSTYAGEE